MSLVKDYLFVLSYFNNFITHCKNIQKIIKYMYMYVFVSEDHMLDWHSCQICYPLEIKLLNIIIIKRSAQPFGKAMCVQNNKFNMQN